MEQPSYDEDEDAIHAGKDWLDAYCQIEEIGVNYRAGDRMDLFRYDKSTQRQIPVPKLEPHIVDDLLWRNVPAYGPYPKTIRIRQCPWIFRALTTRVVEGQPPGKRKLFFEGHMRDVERNETVGPGTYQLMNPENPVPLHALPQHWWASGRMQELDGSDGRLQLRTRERVAYSTTLGGQRGNSYRPVRARWYQDLRDDGNCAHAYLWSPQGDQQGAAGWRQMDCRNVFRLRGEESRVVRFNNTMLFEQQWEPASEQHRFIWNPTLPVYDNERLGHNAEAEQHNPNIGTTAALPWFVQRKYDYGLLDPKGETCDYIRPDYPTESHGFFREKTQSSEGPAGPWEFKEGALDGRFPHAALASNGKVDEKYRKAPYTYRILKAWWKNTSHRALNPRRMTLPEGVGLYGPRKPDKSRPVDFSPTPEQISKREDEIRRLHRKNPTWYDNPDTYANLLLSANERKKEARRKTMISRLLRAGMTPFGGEEEFYWHHDVGPAQPVKTGNAESGTGPSADQSVTGLNRNGKNQTWESGWLRSKIWCGNGTMRQLAGGSKNPTTGHVDSLEIGPTEVEVTLEDKVRNTHLLRWKWIFKKDERFSRKGIYDKDPILVPEAPVVLIDIHKHAPTLFGGLRPKYAQISGRDIQVRMLQKFYNWEKVGDREAQQKFFKDLKEEALRSGSEAAKKRATEELDEIGPGKDRTGRVEQLKHFTERERQNPSSEKAPGTTTFVRDSRENENIRGTIPNQSKSGRKIDISNHDASILPFLREGDIVIDDDAEAGQKEKLRDEIQFANLFKPYKLESAKTPTEQDRGGEMVPYKKIQPVFPAGKVPEHRLLTEKDIDDKVQVVFFATNPAHAYPNQNKPYLPDFTNASDLDHMNRPYFYQRDVMNPHRTPALWKMSNFVNYSQLRKCWARSRNETGTNVCNGTGTWPGDPPTPEKDGAANAEGEENPGRFGIGLGPFVNDPATRREYETWKRDMETYKRNATSQDQRIVEALDTFAMNDKRYKRWYMQLPEFTRDQGRIREASNQMRLPRKRWHPSGGNQPGMPNDGAGVPLTSGEIQALGLQPPFVWKHEGSGPDKGYVIPPHPSEIRLDIKYYMDEELYLPPDPPTIYPERDDANPRINLKMKSRGENDGADWISVSMDWLENDTLKYIWSKLCKFGLLTADTSDERKPPDFVKVGQPHIKIDRMAQRNNSKAVEAGWFSEEHNHAFVVGYALYDKKQFDEALRTDPEEAKRLEKIEQDRTNQKSQQAKEDEARRRKEELLRDHRNRALDAANPREEQQKIIFEELKERDKERRKIRAFALRNGPSNFYDPLPQEFQDPDDPTATYRDWTDEQWWAAYCNNPPHTDKKPSPAPDDTSPEVKMRNLNQRGGIRWEDLKDFNARLKVWTDHWQPDKSELDEAYPVISMERLRCQPWKPRRHEADYSVYVSNASSGLYQEQKNCTDLHGTRNPESAQDWYDRVRAWPGACNDDLANRLADVANARAEELKMPNRGSLQVDDAEANEMVTNLALKEVQDQNRRLQRAYSQVMDALTDEKVQSIVDRYENAWLAASKDGATTPEAINAGQLYDEVLEAKADREHSMAPNKAQQEVLKAATDDGAQKMIEDEKAKLSAATGFTEQQRIREIIAALEAGLRTRLSGAERLANEFERRIANANTDAQANRILKEAEEGLADAEALPVDEPSRRDAVNRRTRVLERARRAHQERKERQTLADQQKQRQEEEFRAYERQRRRMQEEAKKSFRKRWTDALKGARLKSMQLAMSSEGGAKSAANSTDPQDEGSYDPKMEKLLQNALRDEDDGSAEEDDGSAEEDDGSAEEGDGSAYDPADEGDVGDVFGSGDESEGFGEEGGDSMETSSAFGKLSRVRWRVFGAHRSPDRPGWYRRLGDELAAMSGSELHAIEYALGDLELSESRACLQAGLKRREAQKQ